MEGEWKYLTYEDKKIIREELHEHGYGINKRRLLNKIYSHRRARENNDFNRMQFIEYYLEEINFHIEMGLLRDGKYDECIKLAKQMY